MKYNQLNLVVPKELVTRARELDIKFSDLVRRAIKKEIRIREKRLQREIEMAGRVEVKAELGTIPVKPSENIRE